MFKDPQMLETLSFGDRMLASLYVTILGMGITFVALVLLLYATTFLSSVINKTEKKDAVKVVKTSKKEAVIVEETIEANDDEEVIAAITAVLAYASEETGSTMIVRNINRIGGNDPAWKRAGIVDQVNSRLI